MRTKTFLLDANVLLDFQNAGVLSELVEATRSVKMAVAEQVLDEVTLTRPSDSELLKSKKRKAAEALRSSCLETLEVLPGTPQAELTAALKPLSSANAKDQGEAASIALAAHDPRLLFVTGDKTAVLWALNELSGTGERVMRVPVFVRRLFEHGAPSAIVVQAVAQRAASHGVSPSWWRRWVEVLPSLLAQ